MKKILIIITLFVGVFFLVSCQRNNGMKTKYIEHILGNDKDIDYSLKMTSITEFSNINDTYMELLNLKRYDEKYFMKKDLIIVNFLRDDREKVQTIKLKIEDETLEVKLNFTKTYVAVDALWYAAIIIEINKKIEFKKIKILPYNIDKKEYGSNYYKSYGRIVFH